MDGLINGPRRVFPLLGFVFADNASELVASFGNLGYGLVFEMVH
jgi:hypothetical protein